MYLTIILITALFLSGCSAANYSFKPSKYIQHYDKDGNRIGYSKIDSQTGVIYHYDKDSNYKGMTKPSN